MDKSDYESVRRLLRVPDSAIHSLYRCGSRVYGTSNARSDEDFVAVLAGPNAKVDLVLGDRRDIIVHTEASFREALARHSVLALECFFVAAEHRLKETRPGFAFVLDRHRLAAAALGRSKSDFDKAARRFADEPSASKKKLFHALRVASFALQIARHERIVDFAETNSLWRQIEGQRDAEWEPYQRVFGPVYDRLTQALTLLKARG